MKNIYILLFTIIIFNNVNAQDSKLVIGVAFSPTFSSLRSSEAEDSLVSNLGISPGLNIEYFFNTHISLRTGLSYNQKGALYKEIQLTDDTGQSNGVADSNLNFDFISLPILISYYKNVNKSVNLYINGGIFIGIPLNHEYTYMSDDNPPVEKSFESWDSEKVDFGLLFGIGVYIPINSKFIFDIGIKEYWGLVNIFGGPSELIGSGEIKTNSIGILLSLRYKI